MILRTIVGIAGVVQLLAPRRIARFWLARCCDNSEDIELKSWAITAIRVEGLLLVGWVLWQSRDEIAAATGTDHVPGMDEDFDDWDLDAQDPEGAATDDESEEETADLSPESETESEPETEPESAEESETTDEPEEPTTEEAAPTITPGTRRFQLASVLYHADDRLTVADFVDLSEGTEWEVGRSPASTTLYRMYNDDAVDREEGERGSYEYWLTDAGRDVLEASDADPEPDPFGDEDSS